MADLLFNNAAPAACYAAHRLLSEDRTFFKQVGRAPPSFQARTQKDVAVAQARLDAERKVSPLLNLKEPPAIEKCMPKCQAVERLPAFLLVARSKSASKA